MKKIIAASVAVVAIAAAVPLVASADNHGRHGKGAHHMEGGMHAKGHGRHGKGMHGGGRHGGKHAMVKMLDMIEMYDADGDGKITQEEVDQWRAARLRAFDTDGDDRLSIEEYEQLWLDAMRERMVDMFQRHDDDGDGRVTVEEFGERTKRMVMMRDRNDDGVLDAEDGKRPMRGRGMGDGPMGGRGMGDGPMGDRPMRGRDRDE